MQTPGASAFDASSWSAAERALFSRVEDAGLNASAPPEQRWMDGWIVRLNAGKAQRARCVNAVAAGLGSLDDKLEAVRALFANAQLPLLFRITPFTQPSGLDTDLAARGFVLHDDTRVMVRPCTRSASVQPPGDAATRTRLSLVNPAQFADIVGHLRGSAVAQRQAQAARLVAAPVPFVAYALHRDAAARGTTAEALAPDQVLACGQLGIERDVAGLYDVVTHPEHRGQGHATRLCAHLLASAAAMPGIRTAYLQVDAQNHAARRIYTRLGFVDAYGYHYRRQPDV